MQNLTSFVGTGKMAGFKFILFFFILLFSMSSACADQGAIFDETWLTEKTGEYIPSDITLRDETGTAVNLRDLLDKPAIISLVYYHCIHICPQVLGGLAEAIPKLELSPGRDYKLITISFDPEDTPGTAREAKKNYVTAVDRPFPPDAWKFLVGDERNIRKITTAAGFTYQKDVHGFIHPSVLIILSSAGKISGYIHVSKYEYGTAYPVTFAPYDLDSALKSASNGKTFSVATTPVLFCFPHEPPEQAEFFSILGISGWATLLLLASLFIYLRFTKGKRSGQKNDE
jgi:protein SCO1/2